MKILLISISLLTSHCTSIYTTIKGHEKDLAKSDVLTKTTDLSLDYLIKYQTADSIEQTGSFIKYDSLSNTLVLWNSRYSRKDTIIAKKEKLFNTRSIQNKEAGYGLLQGILIDAGIFILLYFIIPKSKRGISLS